MTVVSRPSGSGVKHSDELLTTFLNCVCVTLQTCVCVWGGSACVRSSPGVCM